jgi:hypothetical protein
LGMLEALEQQCCEVEGEEWVFLWPLNEIN